MIDKVINIEKLKKCFAEEKADIELKMAQQLLALSKKRIFDRTQGTEGQFFGKYRSKPYVSVRKKEKLQTDIKDLQFSNDLRDDMQVGVFENKTVIGFSTERSENIIIGQENGSATKSGKPVQQIGFAIFAPSDDEADDVIELGQELLDEMLLKCLA